MSFMAVAVGAVGVAVVLFVGYLIIGQARSIMDPSLASLNDSNFTTSVQSTQATVLAGFGLLGVGIIILGAFGLISIWK